MPPQSTLRAALHRLADPRLDAVDVAGRDQRPDGRSLIHGVADDEGLDPGEERLQPRVPRQLVHVHTLYGDAALAGVAEAARGGPLGRRSDIRALVHDDRRVAAEFQDHLLAAGAGLHRPADFGRAGEGQQAIAVVPDEEVAGFAAHRQHAERARRQPCLVHQVSQRQRRQGRAARRLEHDGVPCRQGRRELVRDQVQREVERGDRGNRTERHAARQGEAAFAVRLRGPWARPRRRRGAAGLPRQPPRRSSRPGRLRSGHPEAACRPPGRCISRTCPGARATRRSPARRMRDRSCSGRAATTGAAATHARAASSYSSGPALETRATSASSYGERTSTVVARLAGRAGQEQGTQIGGHVRWDAASAADGLTVRAVARASDRSLYCHEAPSPSGLRRPRGP